MEKKLTNKLSIYLIKKEYTSHADILKNIEKVGSETIGDLGILYYGDSHVSTPSWLIKFFAGMFNNGGDNKRRIYSASAKAVYFISVSGRIFAITFGFGHTLLKPGTWEERFGLKVALNTIDPENLRAIDKTNMTAVPKLSKEQMSRYTNMGDFGIDIEQDLIQGITGASMDKDFGKSITGKDALSVSIQFNVKTIASFLEKCLAKYASVHYKDAFAFIDHIAEIKDPKRVEGLNALMLQKILRKEFDKVWMAVPEVISWENVKEFRVASRNINLGDDICLQAFLGGLDDAEITVLNNYKNIIIDCMSATSEEILKSWKAYDCIYCEVNSNGTFILSNGEWYEIEQDFAKEVHKEFEGIRDKGCASVSLPKSRKNEHENKYNERAATELNAINLDCKNIQYGGRYSKIEFCDLLMLNKKFIYIKRYGASSVLSHLFAQGLVAGELFWWDRDFRNKVKDKLEDQYKTLMPSSNPSASEYEIVYAVVSDYPTPLDMPFFSKVNLRNAKKRLERLGYIVSLAKIDVE